MKYDKQYHVVCAVYRMLRQGRIQPRTAVYLLRFRAKLKYAHKAEAVVSLWMPGIKRRRECEARGCNIWGQPVTE